jgi:hypothetical protein
MVHEGPEFKVQMFRFVDAFPMLKRPSDPRSPQDYLSQPGVTVPPVIATALKAGGLAKGLMPRPSQADQGMAVKFIAGTDAASALPGPARSCGTTASPSASTCSARRA